MRFRLLNFYGTRALYAMRNVYRTRRGSSLLISLGLVTVIVLISIGVTSVVVASIRDSSNVNSANQAFYAAEGALEQGLLVNAQSGAGFSTSQSQPFNLGSNSATYSIQGQVPLITKYTNINEYGIPTPGTGTAGTNCDSLNPYVSGTFYYSPTATPHYATSALDATYTVSAPAENHPCNWNKISVGETVTIPLYVTDASGNILNPSDLGLSQMEIRVRTPCKTGDESCQDIDRYNLDTLNGDNFFKCSNIPPFSLINCGDTIVAWEIDGTNMGGDQSYTLLPNTKYNTSSGQRLFKNSEIYESKINKKSGAPNCAYCMVIGKNAGEDNTNSPGLIQDFLLDGVSVNGAGGISFSRSGNNKINKPVLKLTVIHSLMEKNVTNSAIPYLEYQILANTSLQPADSSQTITAEGFSGSFKQVLEVKQPQAGSILEYVIQQ